jgi:hypothetical protein
MQAARARRQNPAIGDRGVRGGAAGSSGSGGGLLFSIGSGGDCIRGFPESDQKVGRLRLLIRSGLVLHSVAIHEWRRAFIQFSLAVLIARLPAGLVPAWRRFRRRDARPRLVVPEGVLIGGLVARFAFRRLPGFCPNLFSAYRARGQPESATAAGDESDLSCEFA